VDPSSSDDDLRATLRRHTWRWSRADVGDLRTRKATSGTSVAVVLPARNEAATVGGIVATIRARLMRQDVPLVDELLVVDAGSTDGTAEVAAEAGARVVEQDQVLPEAGPGDGKGEALWKGLAATTSDLVVFVDADILDFDERFVAGLLAPLFDDERVAFAKSTYDRPYVTDGLVHAHGGGRVTELLARPLLAAFWPELSWLAQPLSGEYAGRRELLEQLPFVQGYGVEIALLIDILDGWGADAIAQVDLGRREHDHQSLQALGRMAAEILAVAVDRLERHGLAQVGTEVSRVLPQPVRAADGQLDLVLHEVSLSQRPPLAQWRRDATG